MQNCDIWLAYRQHRGYCDDQHSHKTQEETLDCFLSWVEENAREFINTENQDIVKAIEDWQSSNNMHPFTCRENGERGDLKSGKEHENHKLIPTLDEVRGEIMLVCPVCLYEQRAFAVLDLLKLPKRCGICNEKLQQTSPSKEWICPNCGEFPRT